MTPQSIEILLSCYYGPANRPMGNHQAEVFVSLVSDGLIETEDDYFVTTDRGRAHIQQLCSLPYPTQAWINHSGETIRGEIVK